MSNSPSDTPVRHHLVIAGTGRSGTTFLVRYLTALGLDTHLSRRGATAWLDENAQAGFEDFPIGPDVDRLPYVVKNPMLYEFIDQLLTDPEVVVDGVIIPMRSLREAAGSRSILERRAMYQTWPWLGFMEKAWQTGGSVPGGILYSLNVLDEARLLAMGFHLLIERLVRAGVPMIFLDFPRFIRDGTYLFSQLAPVLPSATSGAAAAEVHAKLADPEKVRIEREIAQVDAARGADGHDLDEDLDRIALRRELLRLKALLKERDQP